jgi:hypothetical protein
MAIGVMPYLSSREHRLQDECMEKTRVLGMGFHNAFAFRSGLFPAYVTGPDGKTIHSWRVEILPYLCYPTYDEYELCEPWNGPNNRKLEEGVYDLYRCPAAGGENPHLTSYVAVVGEETVWPGTRGIKAEEVTDGLSNTIAILELADSDIHWMEPRDLTFDEAVAAFAGKAGAPRLRDHPGGVVVGMADSSVRVLSREFLRKHGKALLTRAGGEKIPWPDEAEGP